MRGGGGGKKIILSCDVIRPATNTTMMSEISKSAARTMRYLKSNFRSSTPSVLITVAIPAFISLLYGCEIFACCITGRQPKCFWHVNVCFHFTSCHWFQICQPFCSIRHSFHKGHTVIMLPLPIVIRLVFPPSCIDNIFLIHVFCTHTSQTSPKQISIW